MVVSQTTSITPSTHAATHQPGGTDPFLHAAIHRHGGGDALTGDVRIDNLPGGEGNIATGATFVATTDTAIDLSAIVGSQRVLVFLRWTNQSAGNVDLVVKPNGSASGGAWVADGANRGDLTVAGSACYLITTTDSAGIIEYYAGAASDYDLDVVGFIPL